MDKYSGHVYNLTLEDDEPPTVKVIQREDEDEDGYAVPAALMAGASTSCDIDFETEDMYVAIAEIGQEEDLYLEIGAAAPKVQLPENPKTWNAGDVQVFLKQEGLTMFRPILYRNGIVGKALLKLRGDMYPKGRFSEGDLEKFDAALFKIRMQAM